MVLKHGTLIRNTSKVLKFGAGGWRRSVGRIVQKTKKYNRESRRKGKYYME